MTPYQKILATILKQAIEAGTVVCTEEITSDNIGDLYQELLIDEDL